MEMKLFKGINLESVRTSARPDGGLRTLEFTQDGGTGVMERSTWLFSEAEQAQHTDPYITKAGLSKAVLYSVSKHRYLLEKREIWLDF